ncbi:MAG: hypothetical protein A2X32_02040 [Elusimicrobia bacterium GWC2_64_44]|nr:MAG: hypothetical protein A2X32_02040 [Elusimicrobia bacterium GWC2_64_44]
MKIYAGTSGFGYKEWKGKFYPEKISPGKMLEFYSARLPAVEINNTFYRMPRWEVAEAWAAEVPPGFRFTVKAPQTITHIKRLHGVGEETRYLLGALGGLGARLGAVLFQFPATFKFDLPLLKAFLRQLPAKTPCAFDFRSPTWLNQETFGLLGEKGFCLAQEDTDESPLRELISTAPWGYLRLRRADYALSDLEAWSRKVEEQGWEKAFVFFKHEDDAAAVGPALAERFNGLFLAAAGAPASVSAEASWYKSVPKREGGI